MKSVIKKIMTKNRLTQTQMAQKLGVSQTKVQKILSSKSNHTIDTLLIKKLNKDFKIPLKTIMESLEEN